MYMLQVHVYMYTYVTCILHVYVYTCTYVGQCYIEHKADRVFPSLSDGVIMFPLTFHGLESPVGSDVLLPHQPTLVLQQAKRLRTAAPLHWHLWCGCGVGVVWVEQTSVYSLSQQVHLVHVRTCT